MSVKRSLMAFDGEGRMVTAVLRPAKRPSGKEIRAFLRRLLGAIRANWPATQILIRGDSHYLLGRGQQAPLHYCCPEVIDFCRANGLDFIFGALAKRNLAPPCCNPGGKHQDPLRGLSSKAAKVRRFKEFYDGAASWSRTERIIARVEAGPDGPDTRFIVTSLAGGRPKTLYQVVYCLRGNMENHIKSWKTHLAADRTSRLANLLPTSSACSCMLAPIG